MDFLSSSFPPTVINLALVILAIILMIRSHARRVGTDLKKKRYHPIATNFFTTLVNFSRLHHYLTDIAHKYKTFRAYNVLIDYVFTTDPANVEYILKTNFANYGRGWYHYSVLSDGLGDGIFAVDGEKWLHQRKISSNVLSTKIVKDFSTAVFKTNAVQIAGIIYEAATCDKAIEIQDLFLKATLDSIVKILLGIELDTLYGTNEECIRFANAFDEGNEMTMYRYFDFTWKIRRFLNIGSEAVLKKNIKVVDQFIYNLINSKTETLHNSPEDDPSAYKKGDIISRLLKSKDMDPKFLRDLLLCLIVAGRDSMASVLTWFIYMLCKHPHIQEKIVQEVRKATNLKDSSSIDEVAASLTEEALDKMHYLHASLSETLRLYPAVPLDSSVCLFDDTWPDGFSVKKGSVVGYHAYAMGRMKYLWGDNAEDFWPERWLNENGLFQQESPFKFLAFNAGPRNCIGKDFAYQQMKIICAVLLRSYIFKLTDEHKVAHYRTKVTLHIDGGLYVQAFPRNLD
ncbi:cytochrome P450 704C1-like [Pyrus ussuriensis x Pyrus communis]|uniref:Cytochrome P450 704C1-like n=1 Tax=Pyrus ussuriensis x Pyrus communis TaxID=2448454 RepID=A0A5N5HQI6_9ROSA|nr:cytochrome P450 704C1-like [Pyrus ussuriensis x Pyrus communis]